MASSKAPFTFVYRKPGTNPPVYVAGTFSNPPWYPLEMGWVTGEDGEHTFSLKSEIDPTKEIQYKFRIGPGNWWVVSEDAPTTTDDLGNVNNVLKPTPIGVDVSSADEAGSTTGTEQSEDIPSPSHIPVGSTNVIIHDETTGMLEGEHEATAVLPKAEDSEAPFIPCPPIDTSKSMDKDKTPKTKANETQREQEPEAGHQEYRQPEVSLAESTYESACEEATATGTDAAVDATDATDASVLRQRKPKTDRGDTEAPLPSPTTRPGFLASIMEWIRQLFRILTRRFRDVFIR